MNKLTKHKKDLQYFINTNKSKSIFALVLVFAFFSFTSTLVSANEGSSGWFSPKIEYISETANCSANETELEISLVEAGTLNPVTKAPGNWSLGIYNPDQTIKEQVSYTTKTMSDPVCFDQLGDGVQVKLPGTGDYSEVKTPVLFPPTGNTNRNNMEGKKFRGYLELKQKSSPALDFVESVPNPVTYHKSDPEVFININSIPNLFSTTGIKKIKFYFKNQINNNLYVREYDIPANTGSTLQSPAGISYTVPSLPDGPYFWTFYAEGDGSSLTKKLTSPAHSWTFGNLPNSGVPDVLSFTKDSGLPTATFDNFKVTSVNNATDVDFKFDFEVKDVLSGVDSAILYVYDVTNPAAPSLEKQVSYPQSLFPDPTFSFDKTVEVQDLKKGHEYEFYVSAIDNAGNTYTGPYANYTIPLTYSKPKVDLRHDPSQNIKHGVDMDELTFNYSRLAGVYIDKTTNILPLTDLKVCWSTQYSSLHTLADPTTLPADVSCSSSGTSLSWINDPSNGDSFYKEINNFSQNTTIFFKFYAENDIGWGSSPVGDFFAMENPYNNANTPTTPVISFIQPSNPGTTFPGLGIDYLRPGIKIESAGNSKVQEYAICKFASESVRDSFNMSAIDPVLHTNCTMNPENIYGDPWDDTKTLPFNAYQLYTGLSQDTEYFFKIYLKNEAGYADVKVGEAKTANPYYRFRHTNQSVDEVLADSSDYSAGKYSKITVPLIAVDKTYDTTLNTLVYELGYREINYIAKIDYDNDGIFDDTVNGTIKAIKQGGGAYLSNGTLKYIEFNDVPIGPIRIKVSLNEPENFYPHDPADPDWEDDREKSISVLLTNPNVNSNNVFGNTNTSNTNLNVNPHMTMYAKPNIIRSGQETRIYWESDDVDISCTVLGPNGFSYTFNPALDGTLNGSKQEGHFDTNEIYDTQIFEVTCTDTAGNKYKEDARVNVIGESEEI